MEGSNSLIAAEHIVSKLGWNDAEYVPLITSQGVVGGMKSGAADYGVMATDNHAAGPVLETLEALEGVQYRTLAEECLHIHHCLFVKHDGITAVETVASHIQALQQCRGNLAKYYPDAGWFELEDTAIGARYLQEGVLPESTGVLCSPEAGFSHGLYLLKSNMEDRSDNMTDFVLVELKK